MELPSSGLRLFLTFVFVSVGSSAVASQNERVARQERGGRLAPPAVLRCERDNTTSFTGRVLSYERKRGRITLRVRTDEETTEEFTLRYAKDADPKRLFLLRGERFKEGDWRKIESRRGRLRPHMRVTVWACYRDDVPVAEVLDWRPLSEEDAGQGVSGGGRP